MFKKLFIISLVCAGTLVADELHDGVSESLNPAATGLWIGTVSLNKVNEVRGDVTKTVPAAGVFQFTILLHVDDTGATKLIKDVVVMKNGTEEGSPVVLVTDPAKIVDFDGVERRNGKRVGLRYGSPAYDFVGTELAMSGGIGADNACSGEIVLGTGHPTNPFRHKFHPEHSEGIEVTRSFCLIFEGSAIGDGPGYGVDRINGTYRETMTGLHKEALKTSGVVVLERVSEVDKVNE